MGLISDKIAAFKAAIVAGPDNHITPDKLRSNTLGMMEPVDDLLHLSVVSRAENQPPAAPQLGQAWIVADGATGAWQGYGQQIAVWRDAAWRFYAPCEGVRAWVENEGRLLVWSRSSWFSIGQSILPLMEWGGVGMTWGSDEMTWGDII